MTGVIAFSGVKRVGLEQSVTALNTALLSPSKLSTEQYFQDFLRALPSLQEFLARPIPIPTKEWSSTEYPWSKDPVLHAYKVKICDALDRLAKLLVREPFSFKTPEIEASVLTRVGAEIRKCWNNFGYEELLGYSSVRIGIANSEFSEPEEFLRRCQVLEHLIDGRGIERVHALFGRGLGLVMHLFSRSPHLEMLPDTEQNRNRLSSLEIRFHTVKEWPGKLFCLLDNEMLIRSIREMAQLLLVHREDLQSRRVSLRIENADRYCASSERAYKTVDVSEWQVMLWGFARIIDPYVHLPGNASPYTEETKLRTEDFASYAEQRWGITDFDKKKFGSFHKRSCFDEINLKAALEFVERIGGRHDNPAVVRDLIREALETSISLSEKDPEIVSHRRSLESNYIAASFYLNDSVELFSKLMTGSQGYLITKYPDKKKKMNSFPETVPYTQEGIVHQLSEF